MRLHRLVVDVVLGLQEAGLQLLLDHQVEERVDHALILHLGDLADGLELQRLVLLQRRFVHPHVVPPGLGEPDSARDRHRPFHRLGVQLVAHLRVGIGAHLLLIGRDQDRMPGRQPAEHLAVLHGEVLRHAVRAAHRIGADAGARGLVDTGDMLLPLVAGAHGLAQAVVDHRPAGGFGQARHHPVGEFGIDAAAHLHRAGAEFAQHVAEREHLLLVSPQRRDRHALRIEVPLLARTGEADRARLHAVAHQLLAWS